MSALTSPGGLVGTTAPGWNRGTAGSQSCCAAWTRATTLAEDGSRRPDEDLAERARVGQTAGSQAGIGFTELSNGFASATDPAALQAICDRLGPGVIRVFAERWWSILPPPLTDADRAAGYWWELSMRQVETSRTLVFDAPRRARGVFEALVTENLGIGRPEVIELIFRRGQRRGRPAAGEYKTKIVTCGTEVNVNAFYRHSRIKQYLKDGRALRIETVINDPGDLGCLRRLQHLDELQSRARAVNTTLLDTERVGQGCVLASPAFERIARPTLTEEGRRAPASRFGDPRVQALAGALCTSACSPSPASPTRVCAP